MKRHFDTYVSSAPARAHVRSLLATGLTMRSIAVAAGVSVSCVSAVAGGKHKRMQRAVSDLLLAVERHVPERPDRRAREPYVPAIGSIRRIRALMALGWRQDDIHPSAHNIVAAGRGQWVTRSTHDAIAAAYRRLGRTQGPSERSRRYAAKRGFLSPAHWDDIDLDDAPEPTIRQCSHLHEPADPVVVERILHGEYRLQANPAEKAEVGRRWVLSGRALNDLGRLTGWKVERYYRKAAA